MSAKMKCRTSLKRLYLLFFITFFMMSSQSLSAQTKAETQTKTETQGELKQRINSLETRLQDLETRDFLGKGQVKPFLGDTIYIGGFFETGIHFLTGEDTDNQASADNHIMGINLSAQLESRYSFNAQLLAISAVPLLNPNNDSRGERLGLPKTREYGGAFSRTALPQAYFEYSKSNSANIELGIGYTPFGIAMQERELVLFRRRGGPQLLNSSGGDVVTIAYPIWAGIHVHGRLPENKQFGYNVYTLTPGSDTSTLGAGARLWRQGENNNNRMGLSFQTANRSGVVYQAFGADMEIRKGKFGLVAEAATNQDESRKDPWSFYLEPFYTFKEDTRLVYLAIDYMDNPLGETSGASRLEDPFRKWIYGVGINLLPQAYVRLRAGLSFHDYVGEEVEGDEYERDYQSLDISAGIAF